jgi:hypothetical protein
MLLGDMDAEVIKIESPGAVTLPTLCAEARLIVEIDSLHETIADILSHVTPSMARVTPVLRQGMIRDGLSWCFAAFNRNKHSLLRLRRGGGFAPEEIAGLRRNGVV